jgi:hypothetical protein
VQFGTKYNSTANIQLQSRLCLMDGGIYWLKAVFGQLPLSFKQQKNMEVTEEAIKTNKNFIISW